jgi:hypothetical protein
MRRGTHRALLYKRPAAAGGGAATAVSTDTAVDDAASSTTTTFTSQAIGTASATRIVVVGVGSYIPAGSASISSVTVGGTGLTRVGGVGDPDFPVDIWAGNITTGTTANIVVTSSANQANTGIGVAAIDNVNATSTDLCGLVARSSQGSPYTTTTPLTVPTGGVGVVVSHLFTTGAATFANLTEDLDTVGSTSQVIIGVITTPGNISPSVTSGDFIGMGVIAAAWGP